MDGLAIQLSHRFDRPVVDETGLKGRYDWRLPHTKPGAFGISCKQFQKPCETGRKES